MMHYNAQMNRIVVQAIFSCIEMFRVVIVKVRQKDRNGMKRLCHRDPEIMCLLRFRLEWSGFGVDLDPNHHIS